MIYTCPRAEVCLYGILGQFCPDPKRNRLELDADCHRKSERQVWEMVGEARLGYLGFEGSIEHDAVRAVSPGLSAGRGLKLARRPEGDWRLPRRDGPGGGAGRDSGVMLKNRNAAT
jgi:hypothetical protein